MTPLFQSRGEEAFFWIAIAVGFVLPFLYFVRWTRKNATSTKTRPGRDVSGLTNLAIIPAAVIAILIGYARIGVLPHWLLYPGLSMFVLGLALTVWAYGTLGRYFSLDVQIQGDESSRSWREGRCGPAGPGLEFAKKWLPFRQGF